MQANIDDLAQLDLDRLTADELRWMYATGRSRSTGSGRNKTHSYRSGVQTPIGDIELSVWIKAAEHIVERDGLRDELERLRSYAVGYGSGSAYSKQLTHAGHLSMCLSAIYRNPAWESFVPYNRQYHPELLETTPMVEVVTSCCQTRCTVPVAQIRAADYAIHCPVCRKWTAYENIKN